MHKIEEAMRHPQHHKCPPPKKISTKFSSLTTQGTDGAGRLLVLHALLSWCCNEGQQLLPGVVKTTPRNSCIVKPSQA